MVQEDEIRHKILIEIEDGTYYPMNFPIGSVTTIQERTMPTEEEGRAEWAWCFGIDIFEMLKHHRGITTDQLKRICESIDDSYRDCFPEDFEEDEGEEEEKDG